MIRLTGCCMFYRPPGEKSFQALLMHTCMFEYTTPDNTKTMGNSLITLIVHSDLQVCLCSDVRLQ